MKLVINAGFGGFSLSPMAIQRLCELRKTPCFFFTRPLVDGKFDKLEPVPMESIKGRTTIWSAFTVPDPEQVAISQENWCEMTEEERVKSNESWQKIGIENRPKDRSDPLLIQVVEELGSELASGACATLKVIEIPDGVEWEIEEYDGYEKVCEKHRTWS